MVSTFLAKPTGVKSTAFLGSVLLGLFTSFLVQRMVVVLMASFFLPNAPPLCAAQVHSDEYHNGRSAKEAVTAEYEAYLRAWRDKDYSALSNLLSDDYQAINFQGVVSTKANEIATAKEDRTYETMTGNLMSVAVFGDCAVASGLIEAGWRDEHGGRQSATFRFLAMLQKQKGDWKVVATQSTKFNKPM